MYKVFIVDDEKWIVDSMVVGIDWKKYDCQVVGYEFSGMKAYEEIMKLKPDMVFTDIRMPGMNGLELIKKVKEDLPDIQFIVLSGYAEFAYAQKAMNYGAVAYCLKPFDESEIVKTVDMVKKITKSNKVNINSPMLSEAELMDLLESDDRDAANKIYEVLEGRGLELGSSKVLYALVSIGKDPLSFQNGINHLSFKLGAYKMAYFVCADNDFKFTIPRVLDNSISSVGISKRIMIPEDIKTAVSEAEVAAYSFFFSGERKVYEFNGNTDEEKLKDLIKQLDLAVSKKDILKATAIMEDLKRLLKGGQYNVKHAFYVYNMAVSFLCRVSDIAVEDYFESYTQMVKGFNSIDEMFEYLKELIVCSIGQNSAYAPEDFDNKKIKDIIKFINSNFYKDITVQNLSEVFYMNHNYISYLFKKEVGENFKEYLAKMRIRYACDLLKESKHSVQQISEMCGYADYFYFTRIFKKIMGMTPTGYRDMQG